MKKLTILVAEDNKEVRDDLTKNLGEKYNLNFVTTPKDAINYPKDYDLLITDFHFEDDELNGFDIIEGIKEKKGKTLSILMSSGLHAGLVKTCKEINPITWFFKKYHDNKTPIVSEKLERIINHYVELKNAVY